tara:strand:+ start:276 stop:743 length:468 start_codon:yes stop_codon:yes gene_type:complete
MLQAFSSIIPLPFSLNYYVLFYLTSIVIVELSIRLINILYVIRHRGKMHNPVTDSGGVLLGKVVKMGKEREKIERDRSLGSSGRDAEGGVPNKKNMVGCGDFVVPLCSLTAIPMVLKSIQEPTDHSESNLHVQGKPLWHFFFCQATTNQKETLLS